MTASRRRQRELLVGDEHVTISWTESGVGDAVLFMHALGRSAEDWSAVIDDLSTSFRCIALDFPGHGMSPPVEGASFRVFADLTRRLIDELELESLSIISHSMGGLTAMILAPDLGPRLRSLVVEDTAVPSEPRDMPKLPPAPPGQSPLDSETGRRILAELGHPSPSWTERLEDIEAPVLLISGGTDDSGIDRTLGHLPHGEVVPVPVGHWIHQSAKTQFLAIVRAFLERTGAPA